MLNINTHLRIDKSLSGEPKKVTDGCAVVSLKTDERMVADDKGLIHGGFIFSAADYTAMLTVNHPNVVLAGANVRFMKPVKLGEEIIFEGNIDRTQGKKIIVKVTGKRNGEEVFQGEFICVVLDKHVLDL